MKKSFILACTLFGFASLSSQPIDWTIPSTRISTNGVNASDPRISMDSSGDLVAIWVENGVVKGSTKLVNGSWGTIVTLSNSGASSPSVVTDSSGNSTAIWLENGVVKASSKTLSGSWGTVSNLSGNNVSSPVLAMDSAGNVIAGWTTTSSVQTSQKLVGGNWTAKVTINSPGTNISLALGGTGANVTASICWNELSAGVNVVKSCTKLIGSNWGNVVVLSDIKVDAAFPKVIVDAAGDVTAIWYQYTVPMSYSNVVLQGATKALGNSWTQAVDISSRGIRNPANLASALGSDSFGNIVAVWIASYDDENFVVQASTKNLNGNWSNPVDIANDNLYSYDQHLSVSNFGEAIAVFMFYNGIDVIIQASESDISGFANDVWSVPINISQGSYNGFPRLASYASGNVVRVAAVWLNSDLSTTTVQATTGTKSLVTPPSNLAVTQSSHNFGVFTEYYNTLSWNASTDANVVGYLIYRNGQFLEQVAEDVLQIVDDNRTQNGSVVYGVAAVDVANAHSQIISVSFP